MPILADQHMHSHHSFDSKASMESMIESAISKGLNHICFTEHNDFDFVVNEKMPEGAWDCNVDSYIYELLTLRSKYEDRIQLGFGLEIGIQESCFRKNAVLARSHEFDFCIGSIHLVNGKDTYDPAYFEGRSTKESIDEYFKATIKNINQFQNFDVLGHMDYVVRTLPSGEADYNPLEYMDYVDAILDILLENEKGIEVNTSALIKGLKMPNPHKDIIKRYKEKGGEIITIGSDSHVPENIAGKFDVAEEILTSLGYKYYSVFKDRIPTYVKF